MQIVSKNFSDPNANHVQPDRIDNPAIYYKRGTLSLWTWDTKLQQWTSATGGGTDSNSLPLAGGTMTGAIRLSAGTAAAPSLSINNGDGFYYNSSRLGVATNGVALAAFRASNLQLRSTAVFSWSAGADPATPHDTALSRNAAGVISFDTSVAGAGTFLAAGGTLTGGLVLGTSGNLFGGTNVLEQRNGVNEQRFSVYNTFTDAANYERTSIRWTGNFAFFETAAAGTGTGRSLILNSAGGNLGLAVGGSTTWAVLGAGGHLVASADNTNDIGASGANRPRAIYAAGTIKGTLTTLANATTGLGAGAVAALTNATIVVTDGAGQVYRVPCIV